MHLRYLEVKSRVLGNGLWGSKEKGTLRDDSLASDWNWLPTMFVEVGNYGWLGGRKKPCWVGSRCQDNETHKWRRQVSTCIYTGLETALWKGIGIFMVIGKVGVNAIKLARGKRWQWRAKL